MPEVCNFIKTETLSRVFSSEFCEISKNIYFHKQPPDVLYKKGVSRNFIKFTGKHLCQILFFNKVAGFRLVTLLENTLAHVVSCEFCEISKKIFFTKHFLTTASVFLLEHIWWLLLFVNLMDVWYVPCKTPYIFQKTFFGSLIFSGEVDGGL